MWFLVGYRRRGSKQFSPSFFFFLFSERERERRWRKVSYPLPVVPLTFFARSHPHNVKKLRVRVVGVDTCHHLIRRISTFF